MKASLAEKLGGKRVLWLGDSITENGNYVTYFEYYLNNILAMQNFNIVSIGLGSETASGQSEKTHPYPRPNIHSRVDRALAAIKPEVVLACYGMNDGIYNPNSDERQKAFEHGMTELISKIKKAGAEIILLTPPPFDRTVVANPLPAGAPDYAFNTPYANYDEEVLGAYATWELKQTAPLAVIDVHAGVNAYLTERRKKEPKFSFTADGVHPNNLGHLLMAKIIARGLGLKVPADINLETEQKTIESDPLYALIKYAREMRSVTWLNFIGYTRETTVQTGETEPTEKAITRFRRLINSLRR